MTKMFSRLGLVALAVLALSAGSVVGEKPPASQPAAKEWPRWRGPDFDGISNEKGWRTTWPADGPKKLWQINLGAGVSAVVVSGARLYSMGNARDIDTAWCLDAQTGKEIWKFSYACPLDVRQMSHGGPASTPTVDGNRVYTLSHKGHLHCLDAAKGTKIWSRHVVTDLKGSRPRWGYAGSPLVLGDLLILDIGGKGTSTIALDKNTGEVKWKSGDDDAGYSSPIPMKIGEKQSVLVFKGNGLVALEASSGKPIGRYPWKTNYGVSAATPILAGDGKVFISTGYGTGCAMLQVDADGKMKSLWDNKKMRNHVATCVLWDGSLYGIDGDLGGGGKLVCLDAATGAEKWRQGGTGTGSLIVADGKLLVLSEKGELILAQASPDKYTQLARFQAVGCPTNWTMPLLLDGRIYVRGNDGQLVCYDVKGKE